MLACRKGFGLVLGIVPLDTVRKLIARCKLGSRRAFFIFRKIEMQTKFIGGALLCTCMFAVSTMSMKLQKLPLVVP